MAHLSQIVQLRTQQGPPTVRGDLVVTPISRALVVRFLFWTFIWNRPVAVQVKSPSGIKRIPIRDSTLLVQVALLAASWLATLYVLMRQRGRR
jgi:hypothetical protein